MLFNSIDFLIFFPIVLLVYFLIPDKIKYLWLLAASYYFYMCWNAKYALLILTSTIITYLSGILLEKVKLGDYEARRKVVLKNGVVVISFVSNLGILFYFKYFNFAIDMLNSVLYRAHIELNVPNVDIILPVGISFYTFQALSYTMDVYRDEIYAEKNFFRYALFVSFFPQLVAGPIERSKNLLKQLAVPRKFNYDKAREGLLLMLWGYFLKIVIADRIAVFVDTVYGDYASYPGFYLIMATIFFTIQLYCDFYGYSVIAMGTAKILSIDLMDNFNAPFLATSMTSFWRRWHISLSSWFGDYLYKPLGGSKKGKLRKYINIMIVFLVSGLWHGSGLSFIVWGGLNGLYRVTGEILKPFRDKLVELLYIDRKSLGHKVTHCIGVFILYAISLVFFRANRLAEALDIFKSMIMVRNPWVLFDGSIYMCGLDIKNYWLAINCILVLLIADICKDQKIVIREKIAKQDYWCRILVIGGSILFILLFGKWGPAFDKANFIYFQF